MLLNINEKNNQDEVGGWFVNMDDVLIAYDGMGVAVQKFLVEGGSDSNGDVGEGSGNSVDFMIE